MSIIPPRGDFSLFTDEVLRKSLTITFNAVERMNLWTALATATPNMHKGIADALWEDPRIDEYHSGGSFSTAMGQMKIIARKGWDQYMRDAMSKI